MNEAFLKGTKMTKTHLPLLFLSFSIFSVACGEQKATTSLKQADPGSTIAGEDSDRRACLVKRTDGVGPQNIVVYHWGQSFADADIRRPHLNRYVSYGAEGKSYLTMSRDIVVYSCKKEPSKQALNQFRDRKRLSGSQTLVQLTDGTICSAVPVYLGALQAGGYGTLDSYLPEGSFILERPEDFRLTYHPRPFGIQNKLPKVKLELKPKGALSYKTTIEADCPTWDDNYRMSGGNSRG